MSENGEIYTAGKNFTLPPVVTAWTNSTSKIQYLLITLFVNLGGCRSPCLLILEPVGLSAF